MHDPNVLTEFHKIQINPTYMFRLPFIEDNEYTVIMTYD